MEIALRARMKKTLYWSQMRGVVIQTWALCAANNHPTMVKHVLHHRIVRLLVSPYMLVRKNLVALRIVIFMI